ncbi:MAG TPA: RidA family protein [Bacteroidales bacterium]|nr:RidA family protein [Bacteroidales bacterium]
MKVTSPDIFYRTVLPGITGEFITELDDCIRLLTLIAQEQDADLFKLVIFQDPGSEKELSLREKYASDALNGIFPEKCPSFVLVCHTPEPGFAVSCEAGFVKRGSCRTLFQRAGEYHYVIFEWPGFRELWASGLRKKNDADIFEDSAEGAFDEVHAILEKEGMNFNHIVRQWNYIGGILQHNVICTSLTQNYQIFNEIRHQYFQKFLTTKGFPAATGIGNKFGHVTIDICAFQSMDQELHTFGISNPSQVNAYQYGQQVLVGSPILSHQVKHPPEFERAKLLVSRDQIRLFISGTASIIGQETIGKEDIEKQTLCTISNIEKLTDPENVRRCFPGLPSGSFTYSSLRVYVKQMEDLEITKSVCRQKFGDIPLVYVVADICRDDLLMEIEGEMIFIPTT